MTDSKLDLKNAGSIRLMELDTSTLFLPYGRPITEYLQGVVGNQNGTRTLLKQAAIDFSPAIRWQECASSRLRTTGFGEMERGGLVESTTAAEPPDPAVADFLPFERPAVAFRESNPARISPAIVPENLPVSLPRISALPLRPRMTFGPAPKAKPAAAPVAKPAAGPAVKAPAPAAAPPKPAATVVAPKPAAAPPPARAA